MNNYSIEDIRRAAELISGVDFWHTPLFAFADGPSGLRLQKDKSDNLGLKNSEPATTFPSHTALACSWSRELVYGVGKRIGREAAASGVNVLLAPAVNIKRNPYNGRNFEYFSEDACLSGELGAAYVDGVCSEGIGACVKHFAANNKERGRNVSDSVMSERTLRELYLVPFERVIKKSSPIAVMTSYNRLNGVYCNNNTHLISGILRGEWGFRGFVLSDWAGTADRAQAIRAGADVEMPACPFSVDEVVEAYSRGELSAEEIFACADRVKSAASRLKAADAQVLYEEHAAYAGYAAEKCAVLLKNNGVLPLQAGSRIAVFGKTARSAPIQGGGSSHVSHNVKVKSILAALGEKFDIVASNDKFSGSAKRAARRADAVIACVSCGGDSEGDDKRTLSLPADDLKLLSDLKNCGKKVICVLVSGGAAEVSPLEFADGLIYFALAGQGLAAAAAKVICGEVNPSGKLAETFFREPSRLPSTEQFFKDDYYTLYTEGCAVGYRYCLSAGEKCAYPFGFGLSYTAFSYSGASASQSGVSFTLANTGGRDGTEIVQIYADFPQSAHTVSKKLVAFANVGLKAGERKKIYIPFDGFAFRSFDTRLHKWVVVKGEYAVHISSDSLTPIVSLPVFVEGDSDGVPEDCLYGLVPAPYPLIKNKRGKITADISTPFGELVRSKKLLVRLFARGALHFTRKDAAVGGTLRYATIGTAGRICGFSTRKKDALLQIVNGRYIRGLAAFITKGKKQRKNITEKE